MNLKSQLGAAAWGFRELQIEEQLILCKKLGLTFLEVGIANAPMDIPLNATVDDLNKIKELYQKYGILLSMAATGNDFTLNNEEEVHKEIIKIKKVIEISSILGVKFLRIFAGFSHAEEVIGTRFEIMIKAITEVAEYARIKGVILAIETHGGVDVYEDGVVHYMSVSTEPEQLKYLIREIPSDVKFVFDAANLYAVGIKHPEDIYSMMKDRIAYMHFKDFVRMPSGHLLPGACGESDMDWGNFLKAVSDFTGPLLIEYEIPDRIEEGCQKSIQYLKNI